MLHKGGFLCACDSLNSCNEEGMKGDSMNCILMSWQDLFFAAQASCFIWGMCKVSELAQGSCSLSPAF